MIDRILPSVLIILFFFIALFIYIKLAGPIPFSVNSVTTTKSDLFTVSGEGKVNIVPDIALINLGVQTQGSSAQAAQDQMNNAINKVSDAIKKLGIEEKDIRSENYNIYPVNDFIGGTQKVTGYTGNTNLSIKI